MFATIWNDKATDYLKDNWETDSASEIADKLCVMFDKQFTRNAVIGKVHRLGLARKPRVTIDSATRAALGVPLRKRPRKRPPPTLQLNGKIVCCGDPVDFFGLAQEPWRCHWPLWQDDDRFNAFRYCGNTRIAGKKYCAEHIALGTQQPTKRKRISSPRFAAR